MPIRRILTLLFALAALAACRQRPVTETAPHELLAALDSRQGAYIVAHAAEVDPGAYLALNSVGRIPIGSRQLVGWRVPPGSHEILLGGPYASKRAKLDVKEGERVLVEVPSLALSGYPEGAARWGEYKVAYFNRIVPLASAATPSAPRPAPSPAMAAPPPASVRPIPQRSTGFSFQKGPPRPDDVAVIIGNASYSRFSRDLPDVVPASNDAAAFRRYAEEALGIRPQNVLAVQNTTGAQLTKLFGTERDHRGQLYDLVKPGKSRVFVYYSGHGAPGVRERGSYLVPVDADPVRIDLSAYPLTTLIDNLGKLPAESVTLVLEACFSGLSQGGTLMPAASPIAIVPNAPRVPPNVTLISAGAADQIASWEQDRSHGLFSKYFLLGMGGEADKAPFGNGDGKVERVELQAYLADTLTHLARRYYGRDQQAQFVVGGPARLAERAEKR